MTEQLLFSATQATKGSIYLRFTENPQADIDFGRSVWFMGDWTAEDAEREKANGKNVQWYPSFEMYGIPHDGLSGHYLEASTIEEAIAEVMEHKQYYKNAETNNWALFECNGYECQQDTPEGDTFRTSKLLYFRQY